jgi:ribose transport system substrate-binding protein
VARGIAHPLAAPGLAEFQPRRFLSESLDRHAAAKPRVALVMKSLANDFFINMADGAKKHQTAHTADYELIVNGIKKRNRSHRANRAGRANGRQRRAGHRDRARRLDADTLTQANLQVPFVGPDNRAGAKKVGEAVAAKLNAGDKVAIIEGGATAFNGRQRRAGFEDAMEAAGMNMVSVQSGQWEMEKAKYNRLGFAQRTRRFESDPLGQ